jgi:LPXTG-site transpeptidase (sortase) family protein
MGHRPPAHRGDVSHWWRPLLAVALLLAGGVLLAQPLWSGVLERAAQQELRTPPSAPLLKGPSVPAAAARRVVQAVLGGPQPPPRFARLYIPAIGLDTVVVNGATMTDYESLMHWGPAHLVNTPNPGAVGNVVILGHRDEYGSPFWFLHRLRSGDAVVLVRHGIAYHYYVTQSWVVRPTETFVVDPLHGVRALTLITCAGPHWPLPFANTLRLAVRAELPLHGGITPAA